MMLKTSIKTRIIQMDGELTKTNISKFMYGLLRGMES